MNKRNTLPTTIRPDVMPLLDKLAEVLSQEKQVTVNKTDAVSLAVKEALERRENETRKHAQ